jgi:hypothetical protein
LAVPQNTHFTTTGRLVGVASAMVSTSSITGLATGQAN